MIKVMENNVFHWALSQEFKDKHSESLPKEGEVRRILCFNRSFGTLKNVLMKTFQEGESILWKEKSKYF